MRNEKKGAMECEEVRGEPPKKWGTNGDTIPLEVRYGPHLPEESRNGAAGYSNLRVRTALVFNASQQSPVLPMLARRMTQRCIDDAPSIGIILCRGPQRSCSRIRSSRVESSNGSCSLHAPSRYERLVEKSSGVESCRNIFLRLRSAPFG